MNNIAIILTVILLLHHSKGWLARSWFPTRLYTQLLLSPPQAAGRSTRRDHAATLTRLQSGDCDSNNQVSASVHMQLQGIQSSFASDGNITTTASDVACVCIQAYVNIEDCTDVLTACTANSQANISISPHLQYERVLDSDRNPSIHPSTISLYEASSSQQPTYDAVFSQKTSITLIRDNAFLQ